MTTSVGDAFSNADAYERYVGRWSRRVAARFVGWLAVPTGGVWLDVGAGTGILTQTILEIASPTRVVGVDLSVDYIEVARQHVRDARAEFRVEDATGIIATVSEFDIVVSGLVLNFLPDAQQGIRDMVIAARPGGLVAGYVWDYSGQMEIMRHFWDAAAVVDPSAANMDAGPRFAICRPDNLRAAFEAASLNAVEVIPIDISAYFADFDDYWLPFLGAQGSISKYFRGLDDAARASIREQLQRQLPIAPDGSITLIARAWAVKGSKPAPSL